MSQDLILKFLKKQLKNEWFFTSEIAKALKAQPTSVFKALVSLRKTNFIKLDKRKNYNNVKCYTYQYNFDDEN